MVSYGYIDGLPWVASSGHPRHDGPSKHDGPFVKQQQTETNSRRYNSSREWLQSGYPGFKSQPWVVQDWKHFQVISSDGNRESRTTELHFSFSHLENPDLVIDLSRTNVKFLLESSFKSFISSRKGKGHLVLSGTNLDCGCSLRWLMSSNYQWSDLLKNATCSDGTKLEEVLFYICLTCLTISLFIQSWFYLFDVDW